MAGETASLFGLLVTVRLAEDPLANDIAMEKAAHEAVHAWLYTTGQKPFRLDTDERIAYYIEWVFADYGIGLDLLEFERNVGDLARGADRSRALKAAGSSWASVRDKLDEEIEYFVSGARRTFVPDASFRNDTLGGKFGGFKGIPGLDELRSLCSDQAGHPEFKDAFDSAEFEEGLK